MPGLWTPCPTSWKLENVQAGLNVVVTILSFLATYVFVQVCWQNSAKRATKGHCVPLHTLISISTPGEVLDVFYLLRRRLWRYSYVKIYVQCLVVIVFSGTAILSGPIVRICSRLMTVPRTTDVPGLLASNYTFRGVSQTTDWNYTYNRLEQANFTRDALIDFMPNNDVDWVYEPSQWPNSSWTMDCQPTTNASAALIATSNCTDVWSELQGLDAIVSSSKYSVTAPTIYGDPDGLVGIVDGLLLIYAVDREQANSSGNVWFDMAVAFVHLHNVPLVEAGTNASNCIFGTGPVESALYSRIECRLTRSVAARETIYHAHPILGHTNDNIAWLSQAYIDFFYGRFEKQLLNQSPVTIASPEELIRFYQVYMAVKDVLIQYPVVRQMSVNVPTVHLSPVFLAVASLTALLILLGLANIGMFNVRYRNGATTNNPPQSRIDWALQSIEAEDRPPHMSSDGSGGVRRSVTVDWFADLRNMSPSQRQRAEFERARYGAHETTTWFSKRSTSSLVSYNDRFGASFGSDAGLVGTHSSSSWKYGRSKNNNDSGSDEIMFAEREII